MFDAFSLREPGSISLEKRFKRERRSEQGRNGNRPSDQAHHTEAGPHALRTVARGGSYLSSQVSDRLLQRIQRGDLDTHDRSPLESLSPRELQVLRLVAEGKTSKDIAVMLDLGLQTIRSYRKTMMKKLGVNNVAGLTQLALAAGITHWNKPDANSLG